MKLDPSCFWTTPKPCDDCRDRTCFFNANRQSDRHYVKLQKYLLLAQICFLIGFNQEKKLRFGTTIKMGQTPAKTISLEEFLELPETKPAREYIDGKIIPKPMPQGHHSTIQVELTEAINAVGKKPKIARAYTELRCVFGGLAIIPDITVFAWSRIPVDEKGNVSLLLP